MAQRLARPLPGQSGAGVDRHSRRPGIIRAYQRRRSTLGSVQFTLEDGQRYEFERPVPPEISAAIGTMIGHAKALAELPRITIAVDGVDQVTVAGDQAACARRWPRRPLLRRPAFPGEPPRGSPFRAARCGPGRAPLRRAFVHPGTAPALASMPVAAVDATAVIGVQLAATAAAV